MCCVGHRFTCQAPCRSQVGILNNYMLMRNLPLSLRARIRENYEFKWAAGKFMKEQDVMDMLPTALRRARRAGQGRRSWCRWGRRDGARVRADGPVAISRGRQT